MIEQIRIAGQALPLSPFRLFGNLLAAWIASHSVGETTPTRLPFTMTCEFGNFVLSTSPAETSVDPSVFGCTTRACSIPGSRTSVTHVSLAATFEAINDS